METENAPEPVTFHAENTALLEQTHAADDEKSSPVKKRNTKKGIIEKLKKLCNDHEVELNLSDTQLNRSSKLALQKLMAAKAEEVVSKKLMNTHRASVIAQTGEAREYLALQTMMFGLGTLNRMVDRACGLVLPRVGYELDGFCQAFEDPRTLDEVKDIMLTILRENPEIASQISNPYIRLMFCYVGAFSMSIKKITSIKKHDRNIQPRNHEKIQTVRVNDAGSPTPREVCAQ